MVRDDGGRMQSKLLNEWNGNRHILVVMIFNDDPCK
jgi:hypothetical protein